jgi:hypothetical protein
VGATGLPAECLSVIQRTASGGLSPSVVCAVRALEGAVELSYSLLKIELLLTLHVCHQKLMNSFQKSSILTASSVESNPHQSITLPYDRGKQIFQEPPQTSRRQKSDVKQVAYCGPTYIRRERTEFGRHGNQAPEFVHLCS